MRSFSSLAESLGIGNRFFDALLALITFDRAAGRDIRTAKRFLFLQYDKALGSVINTTPVYEALRRAIPDARIAVAASGFSYAILKSNPYIDEVYHTPSPVTDFPKALVYFLRHMRHWRREYDCVFTDSFNNNARQTLLQIASGIPLRGGYANRDKWVHYPLAMSTEHEVRIQTSVIQNNLRILELLGKPSEAIEPSMFIAPPDLEAARKLLRSEGVPDEGPLIVIVPQGSGGQTHIWFEDRFAEVANRLYDRYRARLIFAGGTREAEGIERIRGQMRVPSFNFAGRTGISDLSALVCEADLLLTMDTGVLHLGRALRLPMVILTSAAYTTKEWLPLNNDRYVVLRRDYVPCALCWKSFCATLECMHEITVDDVVQSVATQFEKFPPSPESRQERVAGALAENARARQKVG